MFINETGATPDATDTVTVQVYSGSNCNTSKGALLGSNSATVTLASNPWVGTWVGSVTSTCGFYSGPLTYVISSAGGAAFTIAFSSQAGGGGYAATFSGNSAFGGNGLVRLILNGNSLSVFESDSCQTGSFTRQ